MSCLSLSLSLSHTHTLTPSCTRSNLTSQQCHMQPVSWLVKCCTKTFLQIVNLRYLILLRIEWVVKFLPRWGRCVTTLMCLNHTSLSTEKWNISDDVPTPSGAMWCRWEVNCTLCLLGNWYLCLVLYEEDWRKLVYWICSNIHWNLLELPVCLFSFLNNHIH